MGQPTDFKPSDVLHSLRSRAAIAREAAGLPPLVLPPLVLPVPDQTKPRLTLAELKAAFEGQPRVKLTLEEEVIALDAENRELRAQLHDQNTIDNIAGLIQSMALHELLKPGQGIVLDVSEISEDYPDMIGDHGHVKWVYVFNGLDGRGIDICDVLADPSQPHGTRLSACGKPGKLVRG